MKKSKKGYLALLSIPFLSLLVGGLASCGATTPLSADTYDFDVNVDTDGVTLSMWTGFGTIVNGILEPLIDDFTALTHINVNYETKGGYTNLQTAINLSATNLKTLPQIANGYPDHFAGYISSNIQMRLDGFIENDKNRDTAEPGSYVNSLGETVTSLERLDYSDFYSDYTTENTNLEFDSDGKGYVLAVPFNKSTEVMVYNKPLFDWCNSDAGKAILTGWGIGNIFVPETWDEVKNVGLNLRALVAHSDGTRTVMGNYLGSDGVIYTSATVPEGVSIVFDAHNFTDLNVFRPFSYDSTENLFTTLLRQYGGSLTQVDTTKTGKGYVNFNDADNRAITIEVLTMLKDLWDNKVIGIASTPWEDSTGYCSAAFKTGKSVMNVGSSGGLANVTGVFDVGVATVPFKDQDHKFVLSQGTNLALFQIPAGANREKQMVAAWKLLVFLSQAENAAFSSGTGYFPTGAKVAASDTYQDWLDNPAGNATDIANKDAGKINDTTYNGADEGWTKFVDPGFRGSSDIRTESGYIPGYVFNNTYASFEDMLNAVYVKLSSYVK
ncbi:MAG: extracellular solute-binding protein [Erysipelotrichaceae bacterium]|jgi:maltose-binding protein MalE|nr:extracellular solute-binding protein [Erysipelotrichaceae bacterium]